MVNNNEEADGGALGIGCQFALVDPLPTIDRPDGLVAALTPFGIST